MYVIVYVPQGAEPEVFGPFSTFQHAVNVLRRISTAAGHPLTAPPSGLMASIDIVVDEEHHRYQLLKIASSDQLDVHAMVIEEARETSVVEVSTGGDLAPPGRFSSY